MKNLWQMNRTVHKPSPSGYGLMINLIKYLDLALLYIANKAPQGQQTF